MPPKKTIKAEVKVTLKKAVLDPQGKAVLGSLHSLGFSGVTGVRVGKHITLTLEGLTKSQAEAQLNEMCRKLLANPVIEDFEIEFE